MPAGSWLSLHVHVHGLDLGMALHLEQVAIASVGSLRQALQISDSLVCIRGRLIVCRPLGQFPKICQTPLHTSSQ
jgi:hypothetical protein